MTINTPLYLGQLVKFQHNQQTKEWEQERYQVTGIDVVIREGGGSPRITYVVRKAEGEEKAPQISGVTINRLRPWPL